MSSTTTIQQRTVALSAIHVTDGFNPRDDAEKAEIARLAESITAHGLIQPLVVCSEDTGEYRVIDGERRYRACVEASVMEVPVVVREPDEATEALDVALVANMQRVDLSPLEQAKAFQRLIHRGLTRKGVAETLGVSQKLVRERLAILDLPTELHDRVGDGTIPPGAIRPLVDLTQIHAGLPAVAVARILEADPDGAHYEPWAWSDLTDNALAVVIDHGPTSDGLPADVFLSAVSYPLERFALDEQTSGRLAQLAELQGREPDTYAIRFERDDVEAAGKLGAAQSVREGWQSLIVGQDVADQLAADQVAGALKHAKAQAKATRETETNTTDPDTRGSQGAPGDGNPAARSEEQLADQRRQQREAQTEARRVAVAYNDELGAAVAKHLSRLKVDERVVKIVAAVDFGGDLDKIATRGARYGMPGFESSDELKSGKTKRAYLQTGPAGTQARAFLENAGKTPGDLAGRMVALAVMARYANEDAVAQSSRSFAQIDGGAELPWSLDTIEIIDEIAAERLPAHLLDPGRKQREEQAERRRQVRENRAWLAGQFDALEALDPDQRAQVLTEATERFGEYSTQGWHLRDRIRELDAAQQADESNVDPSDTPGDGGDA